MGEKYKIEYIESSTNKKKTFGAMDLKTGKNIEKFSKKEAKQLIRMFLGSPWSKSVKLKKVI